MKSRKVFALSLLVIGALLVFGSLVANSQEGDEELHIVTNASEAVGIGNYVAAEAFGIAAGEDPAEKPALAVVLPYGIYPAMHLTAIEAFVQPESSAPDFTFAWELTVPEGSNASLLQDGVVAIFQADVAGIYELKLSATDANGNAAETVWLAYASTYVGVGGQGGLPVEEDVNCASCHEDVAEAWGVTSHSDTFTRAINGQNFVSLDHQTTGYNLFPEAVNAGFDDRAAAEAWEFPEPAEGAWDTMVAEHPEVAEMANVQCEACHGAGEMHVFEGGRQDQMIGTSLAYGTCAQCHASDGAPPIPQQWENSAHGIKNAQAFTYPIGEDRAACVRCHSGSGYIDFTQGVAEEELSTNYQTITCAVCHDPHNAANPGQLRTFDVVTLPGGVEVTEADGAATCMTCHNTRRDPVASVEGERFGTPHYSTAAELMVGVGGYTWGQDLPSSGHGFAIENSCVTCHMDSVEDEAHAVEIGGHTFAMSHGEGDSAFQNVESCQGCHEGATSFSFEAFRDYDGDGAIETNEEEITGLRDLLLVKIGESGVTVLDSHPYYEIPEGASFEVKGAIWNHKFTESGGTAVHNVKYAVSLLQLSYLQLTGEAVPNAYIIEPLAK
jgi:hypothetical protein